MDKKLQDLVWAVLPKEFKEEVKTLYTMFLNEKNPSDCSYGYLGLLIKLFGIHNLTSDAEGEEEILCVSRNEVRAIYDKIDSVWLRQGLERLFGSKCLPDENKECSNPSVVNCKHKHGDGTCSLGNMCCHESPKPTESREDIAEKIANKAIKIIEEYFANENPTHCSTN